MTKVHEFNLIPQDRDHTSYELHIFNTVAKQGIIIPIDEEDRQELLEVLNRG